MSFADRSELVAFCIAESHRDDLDSDMLNFLALTEGDINLFLKTRQMTTRAQATIDAEYVAVPSSFAGPRSMAHQDGKRIEFRTPEQMTTLKAADPTSTGKPYWYSVIGDSFEMHPTPDGDYVVDLTYYLKVPPLSADATSTWLLVKHPSVYVAGIMRFVARRARDRDEITRRDADFNAALGAISANDLTENHGDRLTPSVGMVV